MSTNREGAGRVRREPSYAPVWLRAAVPVLGTVGLVGLGAFVAADRADVVVTVETGDVAEMVTAAGAFLGALDDEQRGRASVPLESDERTRWHFIPVEMFERGGVSLEELDADQRASAHDLLRAGLSQRGYLTATQVMELEDVLLAMEGGARFARDRDHYYFTVFGTPSTAEPWAWRFEGHHISLHFTLGSGGAGVASPAFVGANPAEVREGPMTGRRVLGDREDAARALLSSLDASQRARATIAAEAPSDIVTGAEVDIDPLDPAGLMGAAMTDAQRRLLMALIESYLGMMTEDLAGPRLDALRSAGLADVGFAWAGGHEPGDPHYYRVQGPTFLIEYDNTQNDANHIHSVWRDFDGDFGRDLLREHLGQHPH